MVPMRRPRVLEKAPQSGDFLVQPAFPGFAISKKTDQPGALWQRVADEENRIQALEIAGRLAAEAGTKAWTYELDNQYSEIYWRPERKEQ